MNENISYGQTFRELCSKHCGVTVETSNQEGTIAGVGSGAIEKGIAWHLWSEGKMAKVGEGKGQWRWREINEAERKAK